jgi:hypothetical protein
MSDEEKLLRAKFYLAPKETSLDQLRKMNEENTAYPGLNNEQLNKLNKDLEYFKSQLDSDGILVYKNISKI